MLPLALKFGGDYEIWPPFAITVLGGMAISMVSTLVFIPVMYMGIDQIKAWLADIGWFGIVLGTAAAAGVTYWVTIITRVCSGPVFWHCRRGCCV